MICAPVRWETFRLATASQRVAQGSVVYMSMTSSRSASRTARGRTVTGTVAVALAGSLVGWMTTHNKAILRARLLEILLELD